MPILKCSWATNFIPNRPIGILHNFIQLKSLTKRSRVITHRICIKTKKISPTSWLIFICYVPDFQVRFIRRVVNYGRTKVAYYGYRCDGVYDKAHTLVPLLIPDYLYVFLDRICKPKRAGQWDKINKSIYLHS